MVRSTCFSWDDLDPLDRTRLSSAFDDPDDDDWEIDLTPPPTVRRKPAKRKSPRSRPKEDAPAPSTSVVNTVPKTT
ncbi:MAG: hypothetical protein CMJ46_15160 [Planctomyces sp.]|nr:hypothetical protein [Planctomyces sp.]